MKRPPHKRPPRPTEDNYRDDKLFPRVEQAVGSLLEEGSEVTPLAVLSRMQWLSPKDEAAWRAGEVASLEAVLTTNFDNLVQAVRLLQRHAQALGLTPSRAVYARGETALQFTKRGEAKMESLFTMHYRRAGKSRTA